MTALDRLIEVLECKKERGQLDNARRLAQMAKGEFDAYKLMVAEERDKWRQDATVVEFVTLMALIIVYVWRWFA